MIYYILINFSVKFSLPDDRYKFKVCLISENYINFFTSLLSSPSSKKVKKLFQLFDLSLLILTYLPE